MKPKIIQSSKDMLSRSFNPAKCKTALRLAASRLKLLRNKKEVLVKQMKKEIALLLESSQEATARIRVEHVVREEKMMAAYDLLGIYCELIVARMPMIESQKTCPVDLKEAVASVLFASPRCGDVPELLDVKKNLMVKYGKDFTTAAIELRPQCGVGRLLVEKLSTSPPDGQTKINILTKIAQEHNVDWTSMSLDEKDLGPHMDVQSGRSTPGRGTHGGDGISDAELSRFETTEVKPHVDNVNMRSSLFKSMDNVPLPGPSVGTQKPASTSAASMSNESRARPSVGGRAQPFQADSNSDYLDRQKWNLEFKDAASAAQAAFESAERASAAARAVAELSSRERIIGANRFKADESNIHTPEHEVPLTYHYSKSSSKKINQFGIEDGSFSENAGQSSKKMDDIDPSDRKRGETFKNVTPGVPETSSSSFTKLHTPEHEVPLTYHYSKTSSKKFNQFGNEDGSSSENAGQSSKKMDDIEPSESRREKTFKNVTTGVPETSSSSFSKLHTPEHEVPLTYHYSKTSSKKFNQFGNEDGSSSENAGQSSKKMDDIEPSESRREKTFKNVTTGVPETSSSSFTKRGVSSSSNIVDQGVPLEQDFPLDQVQEVPVIVENALKHPAGTVTSIPSDHAEFHMDDVGSESSSDSQSDYENIFAVSREQKDEKDADIFYGIHGEDSKTGSNELTGIFYDTYDSDKDDTLAMTPIYDVEDDIPGNLPLNTGPFSFPKFGETLMSKSGSQLDDMGPATFDDSDGFSSEHDEKTGSRHLTVEVSSELYEHSEVEHSVLDEKHMRPAHDESKSEEINLDRNISFNDEDPNMNSNDFYSNNSPESESRLNIRKLTGGFRQKNTMASLGHQLGVSLSFEKKDASDIATRSDNPPPVLHPRMNVVQDDKRDTGMPSPDVGLDNNGSSDDESRLNIRKLTGGFRQKNTMTSLAHLGVSLSFEKKDASDIATRSDNPPPVLHPRMNVVQDDKRDTGMPSPDVGLDNNGSSEDEYPEKTSKQERSYATTGKILMGASDPSSSSFGRKLYEDRNKRMGISSRLGGQAGSDGRNLYEDTASGAPDVKELNRSSLSESPSQSFSTRSHGRGVISRRTKASPPTIEATSDTKTHLQPGSEPRDSDHRMKRNTADAHRPWAGSTMGSDVNTRSKAGHKLETGDIDARLITESPMSHKLKSSISSQIGHFDLPAISKSESSDSEVLVPPQIQKSGKASSRRPDAKFSQKSSTAGKPSSPEQRPATSTVAETPNAPTFGEKSESFKKR